MADSNFFEDPLDQSIVKSTIVTKYLWAWAKVILSTRRNINRIAYIDLFAGPGRYDDGTNSTPILVLEKVVSDPQMRQHLVAIFNDKDVDNVRLLTDAINSVPNLNLLKFKPVVRNYEVGDTIIAQLEKMRLIPTLFFVDPWGYKGLSLRLVNSVLKDWGCDCIFFFNYNRVNAGLNNDIVEEHMNALFGKARADSLRPRLELLSPQDRELAIVEELAAALAENGKRYVLPFRFKNEKGSRTSHHLFFVSKHPLGYGIMKEIMAGESSRSNQGVPSFEYNPADLRQPLLFELTRPIEDLAQMLLDQFAGQTLTMQEIFEKHNIGTPYIKKNYKDVLLRLEADHLITTSPTCPPRRRGTFADTVIVTFPPKE